MAHLEKIAIVGASGRVGGAFAHSLLATGKHTVSALSRHDSAAPLAPGLRVLRVDYASPSELETALRGQQVLIISLPVTVAGTVHSRIVRAAAAVGVKYVIPNVYGSDVFNEALAGGEGDGYAEFSFKKCKEIEALGMRYVCMVCGFWLEWSLALGEPWFGFDIVGRKVTFYDDGNERINVSTWEQCGRAVAGLFSLPEKKEGGRGPAVEDWANAALYIDSFCVSQRDMLDGLHRVLGTTDKDWTMEKEGTVERRRRGLRDYGKGDRRGLGLAMYARIFFPTGDGNYGEKRGLANQVLGLPKENFDEMVKRAVDMAESGYNPFPCE